MEVRPVLGGCLCGAVRYRYEGPVGPATYCHCTDCRRVTGSAFNVGVRLEAASFRVEGGELRQFEKRGHSGALLARSFCATCGSPLFTSSPAHPQHVYVKAGSLDDPSLVNPERQIWTTSAVAWRAIDPALPADPRNREGRAGPELAPGEPGAHPASHAGQQRKVRILGVCGSLQSKSSNLSLLQTALRVAPPLAQMLLFDGLRDLPPFDPDLEASEAPAMEPVRRWRRAVAESDALLIASPEYGFSLPGSLKNAIDWLIGSGELERKVVAITAAVAAPERGRLGLQALRQTLGAVSATIVGDKPIARGAAFDTEVAELMRALVDRASRSAHT